MPKFFNISETCRAYPKPWRLVSVRNRIEWWCRTTRSCRHKALPSRCRPWFNRTFEWSKTIVYHPNLARFKNMTHSRDFHKNKYSDFGDFLYWCSYSHTLKRFSGLPKAGFLLQIFDLFKLSKALFYTIS